MKLGGKDGSKTEILIDREIAEKKRALEKTSFDVVETARNIEKILEKLEKEGR